MKQIVVLIFLLINFLNSYSQTKDSLCLKNFAGGQLGGQLLIGAFYERNFLCKNNILLNGQMGIGLNANGDQEYDGTLGTYSLQPGLALLLGSGILFFEIGSYGNLNKSGSHTFSNLNSWIGLRLITHQGFFLGIGYTPVIYKTFTESSNYANTWIGIKLGANF